MGNRPTQLGDLDVVPICSLRCLTMYSPTDICLFYCSILLFYVIFFALSPSRTALSFVRLYSYDPLAGFSSFFHARQYVLTNISIEGCL